MASPLVGQGYNLVGTRTNQSGQAEYYNTQSGLGFENPQMLSNFVNTQYGQNTDTGNIFNTLSQGYTPRDAALGQIKNDLNQFQDQTFNSGTEAGKRASSSITDQIGTEQGNYDTYFKEYNDLKTKLQALQAPNYQQSYNDLSSQQGIPQINNDLANSQKTIRELPYVNRQNFGNAGVATENQLGADTTQKGIPLEIQQANLIDRLKLAQDFVNNSMNFKQLDSDQARQALSDGLNTALQTIDLSRTHLNDLLTQQKGQQAEQEKAQQFAYDNRVTQPFYEINGTVFRTSDQRAAHNPQEYIAMGGKGDFSDVQKIDYQKMAQQKQEQDMVSDLTKTYGDAGIMPTDSLATAQAKLANSKIYQDKVRAPVRSGSDGGGGNTTKYTLATATTEIMGEWKQGYLQGNGTISSTDYKKAKEWWTSHNLSVSSFDKQFGYLIDKSGKNWKADYGYGES